MRPNGLFCFVEQAGDERIEATMPAERDVPDDRPAVNLGVIAITVTLASFMELRDTAIIMTALCGVFGFRRGAT
jgi:hypothetical protein